MSGPNAPPINMMPQRLPMGQTRKPMGADRVPQSSEVPAPNPGAARVRAATRMGIPPEQVAQRPGYTPPPARTLPRPAAAQPAPAPIAGPVPLPRPRPDMVADRFNQAVGDIRQAQLPMARAVMAEAKRRGQDVELPIGPPSTLSFPQNMPKAGQAYDPITGEAISGAPAQDRFEVGKRMLAEVMRQAIQAQSQGQKPRDVPKGGATAPAPTPSSRGVEPSAPTAPPAAAPAPSPPGGRFVPSQESGVYYQRDPNIELDKKGRPKDGKPAKSNKEAKNHSAYYYQVLGVDPAEGKRAADTALRKLIERAKNNPETITRDEDRLLASAGKDPTFYKSLEESAIRDRFEQYGKGRPDPNEPGTSQIQKKLPDRAQAQVMSYIEQAGVPNWEGGRFPTQADVNAGRQNPQAYQQQFRQPPPTMEPDIQDTEVEEGDD